MSISEKIRRSIDEQSWIRRMFEEGTALKKQHGQDNVFDLSLGNPVMEPPPEFKQGLKELAGHPLPGMHRYMENAGYADTREAVARQLEQESGLRFAPGDIVMTCGAAAALNVILKTILNPADEVIIFAPYFVEYENYVDNHNGVSVVLPTDENFMPRLDALEDAITAKTKAIILNSPNNPTGIVYRSDLLNNLGQILKQKEAKFGTQIFLLSDEAYRKIIYDGLKYPFPSQYHQESIIATSHSKDLALPGERIGYIAVHPECRDKKELVDGLTYSNRILGFVNAPALMQHLVRHLQAVTVSVAEYQKKRDFLHAHLTRMGYEVVKPQGAFYLFPKSPIEDDVALVKELQNFKVLTVPGQGFGSSGYFRLAYCVDEKTLEGCLDGFKKVARKFNLS